MVLSSKMSVDPFLDPFERYFLGYDNIIADKLMLMTCYTGRLRPGVVFPFEQAWMDYDTQLLDSSPANDYAFPYWILARSILNNGNINPMTVWVEESGYRIWPGLCRYIISKALTDIDFDIILIDRFNNKTIDEHRKWFDDIEVMTEPFVMDFIPKQIKTIDGRRIQTHDLQLRNPTTPHKTNIESELDFFAQITPGLKDVADLHGNNWVQMKRKMNRQMWPEYWDLLENKPAVEYYYKGKKKYHWGFNKKKVIQVEIKDLSEGINHLLRHMDLI